MKHLSRIAALILAVLVFCTGCGNVSADKYSTTPAATYGDQTTYLDEANFWMRLNQWGTESYTGLMYYYYYGITNIWPVASGVRTQTFEQTLKESTMAEIFQTYVLLDHAGEYSSELTAEDNHKIDHLIEDIRDSYADEFFTLAGIAEGEAGDKQLRSYVEKRVKAFKIAYAVMQAAEVNVTDEECKSFRIGYILVPDDTNTTTSTESTEGASGELKGETLANLILTNLQGGSDWNETKENWSTLTSNEVAYAYSSTDVTTFYYTEGKEMKTGEAKISKQSAGWYVLYCISDDDAEAAQAKRVSLTTEQQDKAFNEVYKGWQSAAKDFKVTSAFRNLTVEPAYVEKPATEAPTTEAPSTEAPSEAVTTTAADK